MNGFIKYNRSEASENLECKPNENHLLSIIARRISRNGNPVKGVKKGEALIGDFENMGLKRQPYRTALANLIRWGYVTTRVTNRTTYAKLVNTEVYDCNVFVPNQQTNQPLTSKLTKKQPLKQPTSNHNQEVKNKESKKKEVKDIINNIQKPKNFDEELFIIFKDFLQMRKEIKKPFKSDKAIETRIGTLSKDIDRYGLETVKEAVLDSIANQYQGIFVKNFLDKKGEPIKNNLGSYTPPYTIPTFEQDNERWMFFMARYEAYKPYLAEYLINTEYRQRAILKKDAEGLCYELEQQNPNLAQIQVQTA
jgi:hypothetical protein